MFEGNIPKILESAVSIGRSCASMRPRHLCIHARHTPFFSMTALLELEILTYCRNMRPAIPALPPSLAVAFTQAPYHEQKWSHYEHSSSSILGI